MKHKWKIYLYLFHTHTFIVAHPYTFKCDVLLKPTHTNTYKYTQPRIGIHTLQQALPHTIIVNTRAHKPTHVCMYDTYTHICTAHKQTHTHINVYKRAHTAQCLYYPDARDWGCEVGPSEGWGMGWVREEEWGEPSVRQISEWIMLAREIHGVEGWGRGQELRGRGRALTRVGGRWR